MTELKTLKDLSRTTIMVPDLTKKQPCKEELIEEIHTPINELRDAAREWIQRIDKAIQEGKAIEQSPFCSHDIEILGDSWRAHYLSVRAWIKHFFSIEEKP